MESLQIADPALEQRRRPFLDFHANPKIDLELSQLEVIWSGILNTIKRLFENNKQKITPETAISGRVDQPQVDAVNAFMGGAYIEALRAGFDPMHSPPKPTDTVTTPLSPSTEKEVIQLFPAGKNK